jgi:hypothetical protein
MNLHKFYIDSQLNAAILSLLSIPTPELRGKIQQEVIYTKNNHPFDFEENGKPVLMEILKTKLRGEVMAWTENNEEINKFLVDLGE